MRNPKYMELLMSKIRSLKRKSSDQTQIEVVKKAWKRRKCSTQILLRDNMGNLQSKKRKADDTHRRVFKHVKKIIMTL